MKLEKFRNRKTGFQFSGTNFSFTFYELVADNQSDIVAEFCNRKI